MVDTRYFTKNMVDYVNDNNITDILFANNIFNAYNPKFCRRYLNVLAQKERDVMAKIKHRPAPPERPERPEAPENPENPDIPETPENPPKNQQ